jgi:hypothetical protein
VATIRREFCIAEKKRKRDPLPLAFFAFLVTGIVNFPDMSNTQMDLATVANDTGLQQCRISH